MTSADEVICDLEARHAVAVQEAAGADDDDDDDAREEAAVLANGLTAVLSRFRAETMAGIAAKARVVARQAGGRPAASLVRDGGVADRLLAGSVIDDLTVILNRESRLA